eukprot:Pgem_evm1s16874
MLFYIYIAILILKAVAAVKNDLDSNYIVTIKKYDSKYCSSFSSSTQLDTSEYQLGRCYNKKQHFGESYDFSMEKGKLKQNFYLKKECKILKSINDYKLNSCQPFYRNDIYYLAFVTLDTKPVQNFVTAMHSTGCVGESYKAIINNLKVKAKEVCPICFEKGKYKNLYVTVCGHVFCKGCLQHVHPTSTTSHYIPCPLCRSSLFSDDQQPLHLVLAELKTQKSAERNAKISEYIS